jgi:hypothetical protein
MCSESPQGPGGVTRAFMGLWIGLMLVATVAPYLWNYWNTPSGYTFSCILPPYPEDSLAYLAWSRQSYEGRLFFSLKYTALEHRPFLFHPFFLVCGRLAWWTGLDLGVVHQLMKSLGVVLFWLVLFAYLKHLQLGRAESTMASLFVGTSSGLSAVLVALFGRDAINRFQPADLWVVDSNTFWSLLWNPLFPWSLTFLLLSILLLDKAASGQGLRYGWLAGATTAMLAFIHPYCIPFLGLLAVALAVVRSRQTAVSVLGRFLLVAAPAVLYVCWLSYSHPLVARHNETGRMPSPSLASYGVGFGLPLILAVVGLLWKKEILKRYWPLVAWSSLSVLLAYAPFWFQRKLIFGAHIPVCILAAVALGVFFSGIRNPQRRHLSLVCTLLVLVPLMSSTQFLLLGECQREVGKRTPTSPYMVSDGVMEAMRYLQKNTSPDEIVFARPSTSCLIPAFAGNTVVWGHWAQSVDTRKRLAWYGAVFDESSGWSEERRRQEFWDARIAYILTDRDPGYDDVFTTGNLPAWLAANVEEVFAGSDVVIYKKK